MIGTVKIEVYKRSDEPRSPVTNVTYSVNILCTPFCQPAREIASTWIYPKIARIPPPNNAIYFPEVGETYNLFRIPVLNTPVTRDPKRFASHHSRMQSTISSWR